MDNGYRSLLDDSLSDADVNNRLDAREAVDPGDAEIQSDQPIPEPTGYAPLRPVQRPMTIQERVEQASTRNRRKLQDEQNATIQGLEGYERVQELQDKYSADPRNFSLLGYLAPDVNRSISGATNRFLGSAAEATGFATGWEGLENVGKRLTGSGDEILDSRSVQSQYDAARFVPSGDIFDPSTWEGPREITFNGAVQALLPTLVEAAPAVGLAMTGNPALIAAGMGIGFGQAGIAQANATETYMDSLGDREFRELRLYKETEDANPGMSPEEIRKQVTTAAKAWAFGVGGTIGGLGVGASGAIAKLALGKAIGSAGAKAAARNALGDTAEKVAEDAARGIVNTAANKAAARTAQKAVREASKSGTRRAADKAGVLALGALEEGTTEALESIGARFAANTATGSKQDLDENTVADFYLGALAGGIITGGAATASDGGKNARDAVKAGGRVAGATVKVAGQYAAEGYRKLFNRTKREVRRDARDSVEAAATAQENGTIDNLVSPEGIRNADPVSTAVVLATEAGKESATSETRAEAIQRLDTLEKSVRETFDKNPLSQIKRIKSEIEQITDVIGTKENPAIPEADLTPEQTRIIGPLRQQLAEKEAQLTTLNDQVTNQDTSAEPAFSEAQAFQQQQLEQIRSIRESANQKVDENSPNIDEMINQVSGRTTPATDQSTSPNASNSQDIQQQQQQAKNSALDAARSGKASNDQVKRLQSQGTANGKLSETEINELQAIEERNTVLAETANNPQLKETTQWLQSNAAEMIQDLNNRNSVMAGETLRSLGEEKGLLQDKLDVMGDTSANPEREAIKQDILKGIELYDKFINAAALMIENYKNRATKTGIPARDEISNADLDAVTKDNRGATTRDTSNGITDTQRLALMNDGRGAAESLFDSQSKGTQLDPEYRESAIQKIDTVVEKLFTNEPGKAPMGTLVDILLQDDVPRIEKFNTILGWIENNGGSVAKQLARPLATIQQGALIPSFEIGADVGEKSNGFFERVGARIAIDPFFKANQTYQVKEVADVLMHEILHALTYDLVQNDPDFRAKVKAIQDQIKTALAKDNEQFGRTNKSDTFTKTQKDKLIRLSNASLHEVIVQAATDTETSKAFSKIDSVEPESKSLFQNLLNAIYSALNGLLGDKAKPSLLHDAMSLVETAYNATPGVDVTADSVATEVATSPEARTEAEEAAAETDSSGVPTEEQLQTIEDTDDNTIGEIVRSRQAEADLFREDPEAYEEKYGKIIGIDPLGRTVKTDKIYPTAAERTVVQPLPKEQRRSLFKFIADKVSGSKTPVYSGARRARGWSRDVLYSTMESPLTQYENFLDDVLIPGLKARTLAPAAQPIKEMLSHSQSTYANFTEATEVEFAQVLENMTQEFSTRLDSMFTYNESNSSEGDALQEFFDPDTKKLDPKIKEAIIFGAARTIFDQHVGIRSNRSEQQISNLLLTNNPNLATPAQMEFASEAGMRQEALIEHTADLIAETLSLNYNKNTANETDFKELKGALGAASVALLVETELLEQHDARGDQIAVEVEKADGTGHHHYVQGIQQTLRSNGYLVAPKDGELTVSQMEKQIRLAEKNKIILPEEATVLVEQLGVTHQFIRSKYVPLENMDTELAELKRVGWQGDYISSQQLNSWMGSTNLSGVQKARLREVRDKLHKDNQLVPTDELVGIMRMSLYSQSFFNKMFDTREPELPIISTDKKKRDALKKGRKKQRGIPLFVSRVQQELLNDAQDIEYTLRKSMVNPDTENLGILFQLARDEDQFIQLMNGPKANQIISVNSVEGVRSKRDEVTRALLGVERVMYEGLEGNIDASFNIPMDPLSNGRVMPTSSAFSTQMNKLIRGLVTAAKWMTTVDPSANKAFSKAKKTHEDFQMAVLQNLNVKTENKSKGALITEFEALLDTANADMDMALDLFQQFREGFNDTLSEEAYEVLHRVTGDKGINAINALEALEAYRNAKRTGTTFQSDLAAMRDGINDGPSRLSHQMSDNETEARKIARLGGLFSQTDEFQSSAEFRESAIENDLARLVGANSLVNLKSIAQGKENDKHYMAQLRLVEAVLKSLDANEAVSDELRELIKVVITKKNYSAGDPLVRHEFNEAFFKLFIEAIEENANKENESNLGLTTLVNNITASYVQNKYTGNNITAESLADAVIPDAGYNAAAARDWTTFAFRDVHQAIIKEAINSTFTDLILAETNVLMAPVKKASNVITQVSNYAANAYDAAWRARSREIIETAGGDWRIDELTTAQEEDLFNEMIGMYPDVGTPFSNEAPEEVGTGMSGHKYDLDYAANGPVYKSAPNTDKVRPMEYRARQRIRKPPGVSILVKLMHYMDSYNNMQAYSQDAASNQHDGITTGFSEADRIAKRMNESYGKLLLDYSVPVEVLVAAYHTIEGLQEMKKRFLDPTNLDEQFQADLEQLPASLSLLSAENEVNAKHSNLSPEEYLSAATIELQQAHNTRLKIARDLGKIDHYGAHDSGVEFTDEQRTAAQKALLTSLPRAVRLRLGREGFQQPNGTLGQNGRREAFLNNTDLTEQYQFAKELPSNKNYLDRAKRGREQREKLQEEAYAKNPAAGSGTQRSKPELTKEQRKALKKARDAAKTLRDTEARYRVNFKSINAKLDSERFKKIANHRDAIIQAIQEVNGPSGITSYLRDELGSTTESVFDKLQSTENTVLNERIEKMRAERAKKTRSDEGDPPSRLHSADPAGPVMLASTREILEQLNTVSNSGNVVPDVELKRLTNIVEDLTTVYGDTGITIPGFSHVEMSESVYNLYQKHLAEDIAVFSSRALRNGIQLNSAQAFTLEQVELTMRANLNPTSQAYKKIDQIYKETRKRANPDGRDFYINDQGVKLGDAAWDRATRDEKARAKSLYDLVFVNGGAFKQGQSDHYSQFTALSLVYPPLMNLMDFDIQPNPELAIDTADTLATRMLKLFRRLVFQLSERKHRVRGNGKANSRIEQLMKQLTLNETAYRKRIAKRPTRILEPVDRVITGATETVGAGLRRLSEALPEPTTKSENDNPFVEAKNIVIDSIGAAVKGADLIVNRTDETNPLKEMQKLRNSYFKTQKLGRIESVIYQMTSETATNRVFKNLRSIVNKYQQYRNTELREMKKTLLDFFQDGNQMSRDVREAVSHVYINTDAASLLTHGWTMEQIHDVVTDPAKLRSALVNAENSVLTNEEFGHLYMRDAHDLGYYMSTGKIANGDMLTNATSIVAQLGRNETVDVTNKNEMIKQVDTLATLAALRYAPQASLSAISEQIDIERGRGAEDGLFAMLNMHNHAKAMAVGPTFRHASQMQKGYRRQVVDPHRTNLLVLKENHQAMLDKGYTFKGDMKVDPKDPEQRPRGFYQYIGFGNAEIESGIMSYTSDSTLTGNLYQTRLYKQNDKALLNDQQLQGISRERRREALDRSKLKAGEYDASVEAERQNHLQMPVRNDKGQITGYFYSHDHAMMDDLFDQDNRFESVIAHSAINQMDRQRSLEINNATVTAAKALYDKERSTNEGAFVTISATANEPYLQELYRRLPNATRQEIFKVWGTAGMKVRRELVNLTFGYPHMKIDSLFEADSEHQKMVTRMLRKTLEMTLGKKAGVHLRVGQDVYERFVQLAKNAIVVRFGTTLAVNQLSNTLQLWARNVPKKDIARYQYEAFDAIVEWQKRASERVQVETQLASTRQLGKRRALNERLAEIDQADSASPIKPLMDAGLYSSIQDDVDATDEEGIYNSPYEKGVARVREAIPALPLKIVDGVLVNENTWLYRMLAKGTQISDFTARYAYWQHLHNENRRNPESALTRDEIVSKVRQENINYEDPLGQEMQALSNAGLLMFMKYFLRVQHVAVDIAKESPTKAMSLIMAAGFDQALGSAVDESILLGMDRGLLQDGILKLKAFADVLPVEIAQTLTGTD